MPTEARGPSEADRHADTVIRSHVMYSMASGAIPVAIADLAAVSAVQLDMVRALCEVYGADFSVKRGKALVTSITTAALARGAAASVVKLVPFAGTLVGSVAGSIMAGASSFGLGQAFKTHLSAGGTFLDLDVERLKRIYREQFEKGKETVKQWRSEGGGDGGGGGFDLENMVRRYTKPGEGSAGAEARDSGTEAVADTETDAETPAATASVHEAGSIGAKLEELAALRAKGLISDEDYEGTKGRLLAGL